MSEFTLAATGDSIIARRIHGMGNAVLERLTQLIRRADGAFTNLELVTPRDPVVPSSEFGGIHLGMPPYVLDELRQTGFNLYSMANNHTHDFLHTGLLDTLAELDRRGMVYAGAGRNLGEARSPAYLDTPGGRVALVAAASTFVRDAHASRVRPDFPGRPGISPLRHRKVHVVPEQYLAWLREIDDALGTVEVERRERDFGLRVEKDPDAYRFLGRAFANGDEPRVETRINEADLEEICLWVNDARRQADYTIMSLHCHESQAGGMNTHDMADFIPRAARAIIEAGADAFIGHGPHVLRGLEIYRGKPIFYSLGNFMFMCENLHRLPAEMYELYDLPQRATPADVFDFESQGPEGNPKAFHASQGFWQTVLPLCRYQNDELAELRLYPVTLNLAGARTERGLPSLAAGTEGDLILQQFAELSLPFGTQFSFDTDRDVAVADLVIR